MRICPVRDPERIEVGKKLLRGHQRWRHRLEGCYPTTRESNACKPPSPGYHILSMPRQTPRGWCGCSSGVEHNLAKVGVGGSNPLARSNFPQGNQKHKAAVLGRFMLPRSAPKSRGSRGEAAESAKHRALGYLRHGR